MVEFAFGAALLLMTIFAIILMGYMVFSYNSISSAAREAARFAIVHGSTDRCNESSIQKVAIAPPLVLD